MFRIPNRIEKFEFDFSLRPTGRKHDISVGLKCTPPPPSYLSEITPFSSILCSVSDPYHFDLDPHPDPDPRIRIRDHGSGSGS